MSRSLGPATRRTLTIRSRPPTCACRRRIATRSTPCSRKLSRSLALRRRPCHDEGGGPRHGSYGWGHRASARSVRFDLQVWDRTAAKASALNVGRVAQTPAEALRDADIVISSLTNAAAVHDVYLGPQGAFGTSTTALFVEMSTAGPESIDELSREARTRWHRLLEAQVLGSD